MRSTHHLSRIFSIAALALAACIHSVASVVTRVTTFLHEAVAIFDRKEPRFGAARPAEKAQACAYATRIAKRERPAMFSQWRMCPSC